LRRRSAIKDAPLTARVDKHKISRLFDNIITSTLAYTDSGGKMAIFADCVRLQCGIYISGSGRQKVKSKVNDGNRKR
jgi:signal transduction histidine kinase